MTAKYYIYSTLANGQDYTIWVQGGADLKRVSRVISIKGGANVINKKTLLTPRGVVTEVTEDELEALKTIRSFNNHVSNGYITYEKHKVDAEVAAANMTSRDKSDQFVESDFENTETKVVTNTPDTKRGRPKKS